jgi:DNA-binding MarR family transcriptional regulator
MMHGIKSIDIERPSVDTRWMNARATAADGPDYLDQALVVWAREIPDLDPLTEGIVERIHILAHNFDVSAEQTLAEFDLDRRSFKLLSRLRRFGPPYQRSAGMLANDMQLSSGAMTNRLDRMEAAGLIRRLPDPNDRRGTLVEPTETGHAAWDKAVGTMARREATIAAVLTDKERQELHRLLRLLMRSFPDKDHGLKLGIAEATDGALGPGEHEE